MCDLVQKVDDHLQKIKDGMREKAVETLQKLDKTFHNILVQEEQTLPVLLPFCWSEPLHKVYQTVQYWNKYASFLRNNINGTEELEELQEKIGSEHDIFMGDKTRSPKGQIKRPNKELKKI
eukprot:14330465-Ditylum_brightwellii.AAC.1